MLLHTSKQENRRQAGGHRAVQTLSLRIFYVLYTHTADYDTVYSSTVYTVRTVYTAVYPSGTTVKSIKSTITRHRYDYRYHIEYIIQYSSYCVYLSHTALLLCYKRQYDDDTVHSSLSLCLYTRV